MTSIGTVGSTAATYTQIIANARNATTTTAGAGDTSSAAATSVTLSDAAKAALAERDFATVATDARAALDRLLAAANLTSPLQDGALAIDLATLDRRELYAISINSGQAFTVDEQKAAAIELQNRFDQALAGPTAVGRVTGSMKELYVAALAYYDAMGPEEKSTAAWSDQRSAMAEMLKRFEANPGTLPGSVANDPIDAYMQRLAAGETGQLRDIASVASDARTTLDAQYARSGTTRPDYAAFDSRSLAAVALNTGGKFDTTEVRTASSEMKARSAGALLQTLKLSGSSTDPGAFAQNVISLYGAMSAEERTAAGWSENLYAAAVSSYQSSVKLGSMLGSATGLSMFGGSTQSASASGKSMSLMDYM
jgi:hypothetical protein